MCKRKVIVISQAEHRLLHEEEYRARAWQAINGEAMEPIEWEWVKVDKAVETRRPSQVIIDAIKASKEAYRVVKEATDQEQRWANIRAMRAGVEAVPLEVQLFGNVEVVG